MRKLYDILRAIVFWTYERGTWQYDVLCVAILVFIFFIPTSFFDERKPSPSAARQAVAALRVKTKPEFFSFNELKDLAPTQTLQGLLEGAGARKYGRPVTLKHFEVVSEGGVVVGYRAWFE